MWKRLVSNNGKEYFFNTNEIKALEVADDTHTFFYVGTHVFDVAMTYENAILWLISTN